jgi:hypothetical protein
MKKGFTNIRLEQIISKVVNYRILHLKTTALAAI